MQFTLHLSRHTQIHIQQAETDYSWALMQRVLLAFNKENVHSYLDRTYAICQGQHLYEESKGFTVLHICSAHVLKAVRKVMLRQTDDKGLVEFAELKHYA